MIRNRSSEYDSPLYSNYADATYDSFKEDVVNSMKSGTYSSLRHAAALSNVLGCAINSVYPQVISSCVNHKDLQRIFTPSAKRFESSGGTTTSVLWSHTSNVNLKNWLPNHFVLLASKHCLLPTPSTKHSPIKIAKNGKRSITFFFSPVHNKKIKVETIQPSAKHGDTMTKSERKLAGSATYDGTFDNKWTKKNPFIQPAGGDLYSYLYTICSKKVSCSHQGFGEISYPCYIQKPAKQSKEIGAT